MGSSTEQVGPVLALDVGGTKLEAGLVGADGVVVERRRTATPRGTGPDEVWAAVVEVLEPLRATARRGSGSGPGPVAVGVGCGGPMARGGATVAPLNIEGWRGFPLRDRLVELTGLDVHVDNDAKALALGEGRWGAARGVDDYLAMVVSTGVGGGIVLDGRLLDGAAGNAGHIGHVIVEPDGRPCPCGARGCLEAEASGTGIAAATGAPAAEAGAEVRERTGRLVGRAVASVANLLDLRLALVSGSVALGFGAPFFAAAQAEVDRSARLDFSRGTVVRPGGLGGDGPLLGAAAVGFAALDRLGRRTGGRE